MKHSHYFKDCPYEKIDVYRVIDLFGVTNAPLQHALKKILCTGNRGHKDFLTDLNDIKDSVQRAIDMVEEDMQPSLTTEKSIASDGWIDWNGGKCPVPVDCIVKVFLRCGDIHEDVAGNFIWSHASETMKKDYAIIKYRVVS